MKWLNSLLRSIRKDEKIFTRNAVLKFRCRKIRALVHLFYYLSKCDLDIRFSISYYIDNLANNIVFTKTIYIDNYHTVNSGISFENCVMVDELFIIK